MCYNNTAFNDNPLCHQQKGCRMPEENNNNQNVTQRSRRLTEKKKKNRRTRWIYNALLVLLLGVMIFSGYQIYNKVFYYKKAQKVYEDLASEVVKVVEGPPQFTREAILPTGSTKDPEETLPAVPENSTYPDHTGETVLPAQSSEMGTREPAPSGASEQTLPSEETAASAETFAPTAPAVPATAAAPTAPAVISYPDPQGQMPLLDVNFTLLKQRNSDVIGWLYGQGGHINLPLVQGRDNDYYLHRLLDGTWNYAGTLFVDYRNHFLEDDVTVIYGHHMRNDTMFGLLELWDDYDYYRKNPALRLYTPTAVYDLQVMASVYTDVEEPIIFNYGDEESYREGVQSFLKRAKINTGVTAEYGDKLVCLYTCAYQVNDGRLFIICKLVQIA